MKKLRKIFFTCMASLLFCFSVTAQEMLFPLHSNQAIKKYLKEHPKTNLINARITSDTDTIPLPFIDDFSYDGVYPNQNLWSDSNVFINRDYPINPPTLGVATFDGLDKFGNPYNSLGTIDSIADHLTSRYINLNFPLDTTVWLSFFYQPQGLGYEPKTTDSLMVEFEDPESQTWIKVWSVPGSPDTAFQQVMLNVLDTGAYTFLSPGFRFRFTNIANLNGNVDHWHIDYVRLDRGRSATDTGFTHEGAFLYRNKALLVPPYTSMPYSHFKTNPTQFIVNNEKVPYKNLSSVPPINFAHDFRIVIDDTIYYDSGVNAINVNPYSTADSIKPLNGVSLPVTAQSSLEFSTWNINDSKDSFPQNDTVREPQILSNYYSYDDGTAEAGYGIQGADGSEIALALRFDLKMTDTLRGVNIYWNQIDPDIDSLLCNIAVWKQLTSNINDGLLYQLVDQKQQNIDSLNGFATYIFDSALVVSGTIYIGWSQIAQPPPDLLNVGFDKNTDTHNLLYYNVLYTWTQASDSGTVMIRPLFGSTLNTSVNEIAKPDFTSSVFPNPSSRSVNITINAKHPSSYSFQLFDAIGKLVSQQKERTLDVSAIEDGFYLLKITDDKTSQFDTHKILINH